MQQLPPVLSAQTPGDASSVPTPESADADSRAPAPVGGSEDPEDPAQPGAEKRAAFPGDPDPAGKRFRPPEVAFRVWFG
jgi:hypothetical protein